MKCAKCGAEIKDGQTYVMRGYNYYCPMICAPEVKRTIKFYGKTSDCFSCNIYENGRQINEQTYDYYPPQFLGDGNGISLEIDLETGQIQNWKKPAEEDLWPLLGKKEEE